ncbi:MAG: DUF6794 domain-containing protein [Saprospiraceae bacterium]
MKNRTIIVISFLLSAIGLDGQAFSNPPKDINGAVEILNENLSRETKIRLTEIFPDSLLIWYRNSDNEFDVMDGWFSKSARGGKSKGTRFLKYYEEKGLKIPYDMIEVVLRTYQAKLIGAQVQHDELLKPFQLRQHRHDLEDEIKFTTDSMRGFYIPENLTDCFNSLDEMYTDSLRMAIIELSEDEYSARNHLFGIGIWMRNNWQLWGGSRLSSYFNKVGIYHPDDMSGIIMHSYHRRLKGKAIRLDEQVKYYRDYWEKAKQKKGGK